MSDTTMSNECPDSIAEHLRSIIVDGTTQCPLCGNTSVHEHTPAEIVIYRNGVKYGRSLNDPGQQLATTERLLAESQARVKALEDGLLALCYLKSIKESVGKTAEYIAEQPKAWEKARELLAMPSDSTALDAAIAKAQRGVLQTTAATDVLAERQRQIEKEGWTSDHDDEHDPGELSSAASSYAIYAADSLNPYSQGDGGFDKEPPAMWPWDSDWWKPTNSRRCLVKAGALILAEIERIDRMADELKGGEQG